MDVVAVKETVTLNVKILKDICIPGYHGKTVHILVMQDLLNPDKYYHWTTQSYPAGFTTEQEMYIKAQLHDDNRLSYVRKLDVVAVESEQDSSPACDAEDVILGLANY
ncbi:MAG: hypothetical protein IKB64_05725 [Paludibacteraceae bacterium]|nr:hypothetical protein [Paludibacteraceae bacterium]